MPGSDRPVLQMRIALTARDYDQMRQFYTAGLGLEPAASFENDGGHAVMIELGAATLEVFDEAQAAAIDRIEAGRRLRGQVRFALQVPDLKSATDRLIAYGAKPVHDPVVTPWGDRNVRLEAPDGLQITLFETPSAS